ncbi:uncharacterized protein LOC111315215 [Durio zibethinus]|uniref:Uncharacterized protein LOC111315215 n=1 Tax=Durio zibethinus TaxID=66656 RepID=A0A6P6B6K3_DURZI|nr:uncharacterized protein LOC111315215 [Durio zibethinus]
MLLKRSTLKPTARNLSFNQGIPPSMGTCFSSQIPILSESAPPSTAHVVSLNGDLHKYNLPMIVSQVLQTEAASSLPSSSIFLCNSDRLNYDDYIPALDFDHQLQANQIYFVLPISKLQQRLSSRDMAALAVKASVAIQNASKNDSHRRKKARISPVLLVAQSLPVPVVDKDDAPTAAAPVSSTKSIAKPKPQPHPRFSRSASIRKLQKYTSRRAKLAVRSFNQRLSTIYEGSAL